MGRARRVGVTAAAGTCCPQRPIPQRQTPIDRSTGGLPRRQSENAVEPAVAGVTAKIPLRRPIGEIPYLGRE